MTHPQLEALRKFGEALANGDVEGAFALLHDDVVMHVAGRSSFAGDYTGRDAILELFGSFSERFSSVSEEYFAYFADDEHGIILERATTTRGDRTFEYQIVVVGRFRDGKVSEVWSIPFDQAAWDEMMA